MALMNAHSYWKQAQGEILEDKTSRVSTPDVNKHSMYNNLKLLSINMRKDQMNAMPS